jgi:PAS domain S-box-containing protein
MSLQRLLTYLLIAFAGFALLATFGAVYSIHLYTDDPAADFQRSLEDTLWLDQLRLETHLRHLELRQIVYGERAAGSADLKEQDSLFVKLGRLAEFAPAGEAASQAGDFPDRGEALQSAFHRCLTLVERGEQEKAKDILEGEIERVHLPALDAYLQKVLDRRNRLRSQSFHEVAAANRQILLLSLLICLVGFASVAAATIVIRRRVILPVRALERATRRFAKGALDFRVDVDSRDELGAMAGAMNQMAECLSARQQDLLVSELKYRSLFENLRDALVICDSEGHVVEFHDADIPVLGESQCARESMHFPDCWPCWRDGDANWPSLWEWVLRERTRVYLADVRLGPQEESKEETFADVVAYPVEHGTELYVALLIRNVTERRRLEQQAKRAESMEATVAFARGVAHDFNNLLTSAIGNLSLLSSKGDDDQARHRMHRALRACWQAAGLARRLLSFSSGTRGDPQLIGLGETVELILQSFDETFFEGVRVHTVLDRSVAVRIDRDQLTQIVLNLIRNAREAMPEGGDLYVTIQTTEGGLPESPGQEDRHAVLTIRDTGCGVPAELRDRLFEPFFTTKTGATSRSRGMGLAVAYAAAKNAGGFIEVESQPELGATFRVHLPTGTGVPEPVGPVTEFVSTAGGSGRGTVLLVDHDPLVLQTCVDTLELWGYATRTARSAQEAKSNLQGEGGHGVGLAIIEVNLPDDDGAELAVELAALNPELQFILTSGLNDQEIPQKLEGRCARLSKPFRLDRLAAALSAALPPINSHEET